MSTQIEGQVVVQKAILSYPQLWEAKHFQDDPKTAKRYSSTFLIDKEDTKQVAAIEAEFAALEAKHNKGKKLPRPWVDGDTKSNDGYAGRWALTAHRLESQKRPQVVDREKNPLSADDEKPQAGDIVRGVVRLYFTEKGGRKICASLEIVQFVKEGERFGASRADVDETLSDLPDDDDSDDI